MFFFCPPLSLLISVAASPSPRVVLLPSSSYICFSPLHSSSHLVPTLWYILKSSCVLVSSPCSLYCLSISFRSALDWSWGISVACLESKKITIKYNNISRARWHCWWSFVPRKASTPVRSWNSVRDGLPQAVRRPFGTVGPGSLSKEKKKEKINREEKSHEGMRIRTRREKKKKKRF